MKFRLQLLVSLTITVILFSASLPSSFAQTFSASLAGVVTDPSGSAVPGAKVHLRNMGTNEVRDAISSAVGSYKFDNLLPATYEITAEAPGFKTYHQSNMILRANTAASINLPLVVGGTEQRVDVTAEAVLLDTQTATNSVTLDSHLIEPMLDPAQQSAVIPAGPLPSTENLQYSIEWRLITAGKAHLARAKTRDDYGQNDDQRERREQLEIQSRRDRDCVMLITVAERPEQ